MRRIVMGRNRRFSIRNGRSKERRQRWERRRQKIRNKTRGAEIDECLGSFKMRGKVLTM